jgi:fatty acid desaturase
LHHVHPGVPLHALLRLYRCNEPAFRQVSKSHVDGSCLQVFRHYLVRTKDPVPHPLWHREG